MLTCYLQQKSKGKSTALDLQYHTTVFYCIIEVVAFKSNMAVSDH